MKRLAACAIVSLLLATPAWAQEQRDDEKEASARGWFAMAGVSLLIAGAGAGLAYVGFRCLRVDGTSACDYDWRPAAAFGVPITLIGATWALVSLVGGIVTAISNATGKDKLDETDELAARRERRWAITPQVTPRGEVAVGFSWRF